MSPSAAIKTSSPWDRNTFFVSPGGWQNKKLEIDGRGGGTGGAANAGVATTAYPSHFPGLSITATEPATKMFLPLPAY